MSAESLPSPPFNRGSHDFFLDGKILLQAAGVTLHKRNYSTGEEEMNERERKGWEGLNKRTGAECVE